jgi:mRNA interferase RelE/StbE
VRREQRRIDRVVAKRIIARIEQELSSDDLTPEPLHGPYSGLYKLRVGDYRVIYTFSADAILVVHIIHRSDAYR